MEQIESKMVETKDGEYAVNLNTNSKFWGWVMWKHPDGQWVSKRRALPNEMGNAHLRLEQLMEEADIPQKG